LRSAGAPIRIPQIEKKSPLPGTKVEQKESQPNKENTRIPVPPKNRSLTWRPGSNNSEDDGDNDHNDRDTGATNTQSAVGLVKKPVAAGTRANLTSKISQFSDPKRFDPRYGPPPPPLDCSDSVFEGWFGNGVYICEACIVLKAAYTHTHTHTHTHTQGRRITHKQSGEKVI
jgi:hypothetical protein